MEADILKQLDEIDQENEILFGSSQVSPKFQMITAILNEDPILIGPCLQWLYQKQAEIAGAKLKVLYTSEELENMKKSLIEDA